MITKEKIARINELAAKNKTDGLTEKELEEREQLRREYIESVRENLKAQLDNIEFTDEEPKN
ncbi:MAG: DUF896 domain-containing protein [Anaerovoracaceae bacterium]|nr:DUF896 domain-containing protein [Anaerovoracaceae bacterium]